MTRYITKLWHRLRDLIDYLRAFRKNEQIDLHVTKVTTKDYLVAAKKLHADVYLYRKFITEKDVKDGFIKAQLDPYSNHSQYFVVLDKKNKNIIATARQIQVRGAKGHDSFAMMLHTPLYMRAQRAIRRYAPEDCVEISGLAKYRGVSKLAPLLLYRQMWQHSIENHHKLWLLACDVKLFLRLKLLFGPAIQRAGPVTFYLGSDVVPAMLKIDSSIRAMHKAILRANAFERPLRYRVARFILKDVPTSILSPQEAKALEAINNFK